MKKYNVELSTLEIEVIQRALSNYQKFMEAFGNDYYHNFGEGFTEAEIVEAKEVYMKLLDIRYPPKGSKEWTGDDDLPF